MPRPRDLRLWRRPPPPPPVRSTTASSARLWNVTRTALDVSISPCCKTIMDHTIYLQCLARLDTFVGVSEIKPQVDVVGLLEFLSPLWACWGVHQRDG